MSHVLKFKINDLACKFGDNMFKFFLFDLYKVKILNDKTVKIAILKIDLRKTDNSACKFKFFLNVKNMIFIKLFFDHIYCF